MASVDSSWTPPPAGTYDVALGHSLSRALKARKGETVRSKVERELYSFRYNFRPESIDSTANGTLTVKKGEDQEAKVTVERPSQFEDGGHSFVGVAPPAKEFDCVLIFDPQTMSFTLEKVDSSVKLTYDRKTPAGPRKAVSPNPIASASSSRPSTSSSLSQPLQSSSRGKPSRQAVADTGGHDEDAEGDIDDDFLDLLPATTTQPPTITKKTAGKELTAITKGKQTAASGMANRAPANQSRPAPPARPSDDSEPEEALSKQIRPTPSASQTAPAAKATKAATGTKVRKKSAAMSKVEKLAKSAFRSFPPPRPAPSQMQPSASTSSVLPKPTAESPPKLTVGAKREREAEVQPPPPAPAPATASQLRQKRQKILPTPKPEKPKEPFSLALPTGSEFNLPSAISAPSIIATAPPAAAATPEPVAAAAAEDSDPDDWDEVVQLSASAPVLPTPQPPPLQPVRAIQMEVIIPTASRRPEPDPPVVDGSDGLLGGDEDFLQDMFDEEAAEEDADPEAAEDDFLQDAMIEKPPPKSMNDLALEGALGPLWGDDDDDDSSDESESDDE
ncbi:RNA polymerase II transcription elongation factor-domain-containing protein [Cristinia sonorae]|uniref:RNA polymerase II transcription elongation factor-domain-containing protein n=1 Tax=Cristinia sonorae TaxID=1940300 RepID=A0A8K0UVM8_9AGAR|nr:RNA polymerase II transcription elongation factor-domain-containing protein [Cristinia sonorae]